MTLEQALIEHASPTLVGLKPASLFRFQPEDTAAFVRAVKRLLEEPGLCAALGSAAHDAVQPYALDAVLPQVMEQYLSLVPAAQPLRAPTFSTTDKE